MCLVPFQFKASSNQMREHMFKRTLNNQIIITTRITASGNRKLQSRLRTYYDALVHKKMWAKRNKIKEYKTNTTIQNLQDAAKAILRGKFIAIQAFLKKTRKISNNNLTHHLKELEKEEQTKHKVSRRKEIIKISEKINKRLKNQ